MNKGDLILIVILLASAAAVGLNEWNILHGYDQFTSYEWQFLQALLAGELLFFAVYKIGKGAIQARGGRVVEQVKKNDEDKAKADGLTKANEGKEIP